VGRASEIGGRIFEKIIWKSGSIGSTFAPRFGKTLETRNFSINSSVMKKDIHPSSYRTVVFKDISTDEAFMGRSCVNTKDTITWEDGQEYPLVKMEISAYSHPFFTGKMKFVDTAGRIDKFNKKFANTKFAKEMEKTEE